MKVVFFWWGISKGQEGETTSATLGSLQYRGDTPVVELFHVTLIILLIAHLSSLCFSSVLQTCAVTFITIDVGGLILCGQTIKVTVYTNAQLIFPLSL